MYRMYLMPAWMLGSSCLMSPTFCSAPVFGITCITPTAPTALRRSRAGPGTRLGPPLHPPARPAPAAAFMVEARLLVPLRRHEQVIHVVLLTVLAHEIDDLAESRNVLRRCRRVRVLETLQVLLQQHVSLQ